MRTYAWVGRCTRCIVLGEVIQLLDADAGLACIIVLSKFLIVGRLIVQLVFMMSRAICRTTGETIHRLHLLPVQLVHDVTLVELALAAC